MKSNISNLAIVTYTNSVCEDVWPVYFGQIDKFGNKLKSYVFSNKLPESVSVTDSHKFVLYDNSDPYYKQYNGCLESVEEDYIVYCQEDFILTDTIQYEEIEKCLDVLSSTDYSFIRLVRTDIGAWKHYKECRKRNWEKIELSENIFCAHSTDYKDSLQEGPYHWTPEVWPHICTAVGRGLWSISLHQDRLLSVLNEYGIDPRKRGVR